MESLKAYWGGWVAVLAAFCAGQAWAAPSKITSIDFIGTKDPNRVEIRADGPVNFDKQVNEQDKQVVIEVKNATLARAASRKIDTSSFNSKVLLISPYQVEDQADTVRIVLQLREKGDVDVSANEKGLVALIASPGGEPVATAPAAEADEDTIGVVKRKKSAAVEMPDGSKQLETDSRTSLQKKMDRFLTNIETRHFTGRPITLQARDMDIGDVFRLISETSGFNILLSSEVTGKISLSLVEVPWDQALDVILKTQGLAGERTGNILRILSINHLTTERIRDAQAKAVAVSQVQRLTRIFPISYADLEDLRAEINQLMGLSGGRAGGGGEVKAPGSGIGSIGGMLPSGTSAGTLAGAPPPQAGAGAGGGGGEAPLGGGISEETTTSIVTGGPRTIVADKRTNSLIVRDIPEHIEKISKLIELLDVQTPQIMIDGKIVEATEGFSKTMNGRMGISANPSFASFNGGNPTGSLLGSVGDITSASSGSGLFGISFLHGIQQLNAILNIGESDNTIKVVSSPKTVVSNKSKAKVIQTTPVAFLTTTIASGATNQTVTILNGELSLEAVPTVTNEGSIRMELTLHRDVAANLGSTFGQAIATRAINTDVVVDSGTTLVLGGIYSVTDQTSSSGFPFLRKLPIIGSLFGTETQSTDRNELFFFITPQILNPKKAGFGT